MLKTLIIKELLVQSLESKFVICYTAVFALIFTSIINLGIQYKRDAHDASVMREQSEQKLKAAKSVGESTRFKVIVPPNRLRVFSLGFDKEMSKEFAMRWVEETGQINNDDPLYLQYKIYDLGFIITVIISLMAIFKL
jgi:hypothetical protein